MPLLTVDIKFFTWLILSSSLSSVKGIDTRCSMLCAMILLTPGQSRGFQRFSLKLASNNPICPGHEPGAKPSRPRLVELVAGRSCEPSKGVVVDSARLREGSAYPDRRNFGGDAESDRGCWRETSLLEQWKGYRHPLRGCRQIALTPARSRMVAPYFANWPLGARFTARLFGCRGGTFVSVDKVGISHACVASPSNRLK